MDWEPTKRLREELSQLSPSFELEGERLRWEWAYDAEQAERNVERGRWAWGCCVRYLAVNLRGCAFRARLKAEIDVAAELADANAD